MRIGVNRTTIRRRQRGFSLLETLVALAIVSAAAAAMYQTVAVQFRYAERVDVAVGRGLDALTTQMMAQSLVAGLTPAWPEEDAAFVGDAKSFSGQSANAMHTDESRLAPFKIELADAEDSTVLRYESGEIVWDLLRLPPGEYRFSYRGVDLVWRAEWPPAQPLDLPPFNDGAQLDAPVLPRAIMLSADDGGGEPHIVWMAAPEWRHGPAARADLFTR